MSDKYVEYSFQYISSHSVFSLREKISWEHCAFRFTSSVILHWFFFFAFPNMKLANAFCNIVNVISSVYDLLQMYSWFTIKW